MTRHAYKHNDNDNNNETIKPKSVTGARASRDDERDATDSKGNKPDDNAISNAIDERDASRVTDQRDAQRDDPTVTDQRDAQTTANQSGKQKVRTRNAERFVQPTLDDVRAYCVERGSPVNPEKFLNHYVSNGWLVGKAPMKDWKAAVRTWEKNGIDGARPTTNGPPGIPDGYLKRRAFSVIVTECLKKWVSHKASKGDPYTREGLEQFISMSAGFLEQRGEAELVNMLNRNMASNSGYPFDRNYQNHIVGSQNNGGETKNGSEFRGDDGQLYYRYGGHNIPEIEA